MTTEALLLIGRETAPPHGVFETHAARLSQRGCVDEVHVATYESEPVRGLREQFRRIDADRVYAQPMCVAHGYDTVDGIPDALSYVDGEVRYCEPIGQNPAVTEVLIDRAAEQAASNEDLSLVLAGFGSGTKPYHRQTVEYHAARIRERGSYGEVVTCYLLQNPTVECVRYNVSKPETVAAPVFLAPSEATEEEIPAKLELDRGGIRYADPLGAHVRITDAIQAELDKQRTLAENDGTAASFEAELVQNRRPVATDGEGRP